MNRYKPVGWRNEPHRHYLAAKGIRTTVDPIKSRYFAEKEEMKEEVREEKKEPWPVVAKRESMENIKRVAEEEFQDPKQREKYIEFMKKGFVEHAAGNYTVPSYAKEWAERFKKRRAWASSDFDRRKVLKKVWPSRYGHLKLDEDARREWLEN